MGQVMGNRFSRIHSEKVFKFRIQNKINASGLAQKI